MQAILYIHINIQYVSFTLLVCYLYFRYFKTLTFNFKTFFQYGCPPCMISLCVFFLNKGETHIVTSEYSIFDQIVICLRLIERDILKVWNRLHFSTATDPPISASLCRRSPIFPWSHSNGAYTRPLSNFDRHCNSRFGIYLWYRKGACHYNLVW